MLKQAVEDMRQHLVRAVADEHLRGIHPVVAGDLVFQRIGVGRRIQTQAVIQLRLNRIHHPRRRPVGILVGIELDQVLDLGLLTRYVRHQVVDKGTPETTHGQSSIELQAASRKLQANPGELSLHNSACRLQLEACR